MLSSVKRNVWSWSEPHRAVGASAVIVDDGEVGKSDTGRLPADRPTRWRWRQWLAVNEPAQRPFAAHRFERQLLASPFDQCPVRRIDDLRPLQCGRPR